MADEMVGRLARYLRILGCDTTYVRGWSDDDIVARAKQEDRIVVTRDRDLARRATGSILLTSSRLEDQVRTMRAAFPDLTPEVRFERCTLCNGGLARWENPPPAPAEAGVPWERVARGLPLYRCEECGHLYWEGSHTAEVRRRLREWSPEVPP